MANILEFQPRPTRQTQNPAILRGTAQIVIFPGIRYERIETEVARPKRRPARRRTADDKARRQG